MKSFFLHLSSFYPTRHHALIPPHSNVSSFAPENTLKYFIFYLFKFKVYGGTQKFNNQTEQEANATISFVKTPLKLPRLLYYTHI